MEKANLLSNLPENLKDEIFENILTGENVRIERIISYGHTSPKEGWYDQKENEWVLLLDGEAVLSFKDKTAVRLKAGDYIDIPAHTKHKVSWTLPDSPTIWLAVFH